MVELLESATARARRGVARHANQASASGWFRPSAPCTPVTVRLIERCRSQTDVTIVSIFVNPDAVRARRKTSTAIPGSLDDDLKLCDGLRRRDIVFAPSVQTMYPSGVGSTFVEVDRPSGILEGQRAGPATFAASRPWF